MNVFRTSAIFYNKYIKNTRIYYNENKQLFFAKKLCCQTTDYFGIVWITAIEFVGTCLDRGWLKCVQNKSNFHLISGT